MCKGHTPGARAIGTRSTFEALDLSMSGAYMPELCEIDKKSGAISTLSEKQWKEGLRPNSVFRATGTRSMPEALDALTYGAHPGDASLQEIRPHPKRPGPFDATINHRYSGRGEQGPELYLKALSTTEEQVRISHINRQTHTYLPHAKILHYITGFKIVHGPCRKKIPTTTK